MDTIAVIIPAYQAEAWLAEAVESVLAQTRCAASVIVVDDGSTDATGAVAERYADAVMLLRQKNAGVCAARNHGAAQATADWLLFLDADDRLRTDALATLAHRAHDGTCGVVYGRTVDFRGQSFDEPRGSNALEGPPPAAARASFWKAPLSTPGAAMIRREAFASAGRWNERFNTTADRDLWCRLGTEVPFGFADRVVLERRLHDENMSANKDRARRQAVEVQLHFLTWCRKRAIDPDFLETSEREILERNTLRAFEEEALGAAAWIAEEARTRSLEGEVFDRARRLAAMPRFAAKLELKVRSSLGL